MIAGGPTGGSRGPAGSGESDPRGGPSSDGPHPRAGSSDPRDEAGTRSAAAQRDEASATSARRAASSAQDGSKADERSSARAATGSERSPFDALRSAIAHGIEGAGYVETLFRVRKDRAELALRRTITMVVVGLLAATATIALILGAVVLIVAGVSQGFAHAFGERTWLGNLVGGAMILVVIALGAWIANASIARRELARKIAKYAELERRHAERASHVDPTRRKMAEAHDESTAQRR
jgi:hypothetical protein